MGRLEEAGTNTSGALFFEVEEGLGGGPLVVGKGNALYLRGWCFHTAGRIVGLEILRPGLEPHVVGACGLPRADVFNREYRQRDPLGQSRLSGWWTILPFAQTSKPTTVELTLRARLEDGTVATAPLGSVQSLPDYPDRVEPVAVTQPRTGDTPLIAICMATYNPSQYFFQQQVDSIRAQSHANWVCIINDDCSEPAKYEKLRDYVAGDARFHVYRNERNMGFYHNFEHALRRVPPSAAFVAFSDQDDYWFPEKLGALLAGFTTEDTLLVYSDMNIVAESGYKMSGTYWTTRSNNYTDLGFMMLANTVTAAASMMRSSLIEHVLPFHPRVADTYHDNFIACIALSLGRINYIDRPLYDYIQHGANVLGHYATTKGILGPLQAGWYYAGKLLRINYATEVADFQSHLALCRHQKTIYYENLVRRVLMAHVLGLRCGGSAGKAELAHIRRYKSYEAGGLLSLALQYLRNRVTGKAALAVHTDRLLLEGVAEAEALKFNYRLRGKHMLKALQNVYSAGMAPAAAASVMAAASVGATRGAAPEGKVTETANSTLMELIEGTLKNQVALAVPAENLRRVTAPLHVRIDPTEPRRVNVLIGIIDFKYFFGGYISVFNLVKRIVQEGYNVRMIIIDYCEFKPHEWREKIKGYHGLEDFFDIVELVNAYDREANVIPLSPADVFFATSWWSATIARGASEALENKRFIYLSQEYEPIFYSTGSIYAYALRSYDFDYNCIYSTEILREYHKLKRIGLYKDNPEEGDARSTFMNNAVLSFEVSRQKMSERRRKRFLFYARPEQHAQRNMFELGVCALSEAIKSGALDPDFWEFYGVGSIDSSNNYSLYNEGTCLRMLPKLDLKTYCEIMPSFDLGMSLMMSPHPSLVPIEMAASGMVVVTNTFENKTRERLLAISTNFEPAEPTVDGVAAAIVRAAARLDDHDARMKGSTVNWPQSWEACLNAEMIGKLRSFIPHEPGRYMELPKG